MTKPRRTYKPTTAEQAAIAEQHLLNGKTQTEAATLVGVTDRTLRRWASDGLLTIPTPEEVTAHAVQQGRQTIPAPLPALLPDTSTAGQNQPLEARLLADVRLRYFRLSAAFAQVIARDDLASLNPADLEKWVNLLDKTAARALELERENPEANGLDEVAARLELQRRREMLAAQYDRVSGGDDPATWN